MADRVANREGVGAGPAAFARSFVLLGIIVVGIPWALAAAARQRFGGGAPFHGVASPADWQFDRIRSALTDRLTEQTIADIVIRLALVVAWVGVVVLVLTVVGEVVHMIRHDGLALPEIRGLGLSQRTARVIASGLLAVVPLFTSSAGAIARDTTALLPDRPVATAAPGPAGRPADVETREPDASVAAPAASARYTVRPGDSIFGIAERMAGPDNARVAAFAEQLVDLNLGRQMADGRYFNNAAFIDVGWTLELPGRPGADHGVASATADTEAGAAHLVERGETLWSIADEELGDPARWPEVYDANAGRTFEDGRTLHDPDLIQPGWNLRLPADVSMAGDVEAAGGSAGTTDVESRADMGPDDRSNAVPDRFAASLDASAVENMGPVTDAAAQPGTDVAQPTAARRDNVWDDAPAPVKRPVDAAVAGGVVGGVADLDRSQGGDPVGSEDGQRLASMLMLGSSAMLSAGALTLLAVRRRTRLRRAKPRAVLPPPRARAAATERALRAIDAGERFVRVHTAVRAAAVPLVDHGARVLVVLVATDGGIELMATDVVTLPAPWEGAGDTWRLPASTPLELLAESAHGVAVPCPTLVQLGRDDRERDVYVDLEAVEAIEVGGPGDRADAIVAAIAATLAGSTLAEVTTLIGLGVPDDAFLGHRLYTPVRDATGAFEAAADAVGTTAAMTTPTFELRVRGSSGETWEPAVVLVGAAAGTVSPPSCRTGLAVVSASPVLGPSSRLAPDGDFWLMMPACVRLTPVGLTPDEIGAIADLVSIVEPEPEPERGSPLDRPASDDDHTIIQMRDDLVGAGPPGPVAVLDESDAHMDGASRTAPGAGAPVPSHQLLVRLLGPVRVVDRDNRPVTFERSKTRELIAWLATHRERSTRSAARTALWELDVRDATFANVVSEARRSLARLVEPPGGEEWVGRTMTDALPLHPLVLTDVDLVRHALGAARLEPPAQAIATLAPAVELIAGMPFEGTAYLWPDSEGLTSNLVLLATTATTELAAHCLSIGDIEGVFAATGRGLQVLPAHEELIGLRMQAHARAGDHAGVRQEWESYERVINADPWSDGEPAPKLVELRQQLLNPSR